MGLFSLFGKGQEKNSKFNRIFFATDVHGSTVTYHKLINSANVYDTKILIMGGDIIGKLLIPIISTPDGRKRVTLHGQLQWIQKEEELKNIIKNIELLGFYYVEMTEEQFNATQQDKKKVEKILLQKADERLLSWIEFADERLKEKGVKLYVTGGNDDPPETLEFLEKHQTDNVLMIEHRSVNLSEIHTMVSLGVSNPTPWHTPREYPEEVIAEKIEKTVEGIDDFTNVIFNFHVPPYDCGLDRCPELDTSVFPPAPVMRGGQQVFKSVGSSAVREAIEKYQPLAVLCGHIHESKGTANVGRTFVINPGSEYGEGILHGAIINLGDGKILSWQMTSG